MNANFVMTFFPLIVCREALELLPMCMILNKTSLESLHNEKLWPHFIIDLVLFADNRLMW